jgi:hypothetical protein
MYLAYVLDASMMLVDDSRRASVSHTTTDIGTTGREAGQRVTEDANIDIGRREKNILPQGRLSSNELAGGERSPRTTDPHLVASVVSSPLLPREHRRPHVREAS